MLVDQLVLQALLVIQVQLEQKVTLVRLETLDQLVRPGWPDQRAQLAQLV